MKIADIDACATLPYAHGGAPVSGVLRDSPGDFFVEEKLGFEPDGEGEHVYLWIEKTGLNTQSVADQLARIAGVKPGQISYSGMKDRHAVTRQWFSVHLPGRRSIDWTVLNNDQISVLRTICHRKKLRRGTHKSNFFRIRLKQLRGSIDILETRLNTVNQRGVPNYFGEQRFGRNGANLQQALQWFSGKMYPTRRQRGFYLSAARSFLFNLVLAEHVKAQSWDRCEMGQLCVLNGTNSIFVAVDENLDARLTSADIHPTGPLYGSDTRSVNSDNAAACERQVLANYSVVVEGLKQAGLKHERRALRMVPTDFSWHINSDTIELSFSLQSGCFATSLVRELVSY